MEFSSSTGFLLFLGLYLSCLQPTVARGGDRSSSHSGFLDSSYGVSTRHLSEEKHSGTRVDIAQGYMSNPDLEKAMKAFNRRCSNISRMYRYFWDL